VPLSDESVACTPLFAALSKAIRSAVNYRRPDRPEPSATGTTIVSTRTRTGSLVGALTATGAAAESPTARVRRRGADGESPPPRVRRRGAAAEGMDIDTATVSHWGTPPTRRPRRSSCPPCRARDVAPSGVRYGRRGTERAIRARCRGSGWSWSWTRWGGRSWTRRAPGSSVAVCRQSARPAAA
jgi:hypothetical protein